MPNVKIAVANRLDAVEERLLKNLMLRSGLSRARVIGNALREKAEREGLDAGAHSIATRRASSIEDDFFADLPEEEREAERALLAERLREGRIAGNRVEGAAAFAQIRQRAADGSTAANSAPAATPTQ